MPLTDKGKSILRDMATREGTKKGTSHFYAAINAGKLKGAH